MNSLHSVSLCPNGEWIVNLFVFLCYLVQIISACDKEYIKSKGLPIDWPCEWENGTIPFAYNFFSQNPKRLIGLVRTGHEYLEEMSCLRFKEHDPVVIAKQPNATYIYYTYSGVLENCCLDFYSKPVGQRLVLISPMCTLPLEVAHVTLHGMGLWHPKQRAFSEARARAVMFPQMCKEALYKAKKYDLKLPDLLII